VCAVGQHMWLVSLPVPRFCALLSVYATQTALAACVAVQHPTSVLLAPSSLFSHLAATAAPPHTPLVALHVLSDVCSHPAVSATQHGGMQSVQQVAGRDCLGGELERHVDAIDPQFL
jgi:hypothetical protein